VTLSTTACGRTTSCVYRCVMSVHRAEAGSATRPNSSVTRATAASTAHATSVTRIESSRTIRDSVAQRIHELISSGKLGEDGRLPTERELAMQLGVSRTTVRQVLDRLEHEGAVHRRRGRSGGTFVNRPRVDIDFSYLAGIPAYLRAQGFRPGAHVVSARMIPADDTTASALCIAPGTLVYDVVRIRLADEVRISLENARIPVSLAPDLLSQRLDDSIYDLLIERYGVACVKAIERMVAVLANSEQSELLGIKVGDPLMAIERVAYDSNETPVEYSSDLFVGDRTTVIAWAHGEIKPSRMNRPHRVTVPPELAPATGTNEADP
jgi:GntR family transcriptional regulator